MNENRTFFCSELVAKAFKTLNIIENDDTSCTLFYPGHFSHSGEAFLRFNPKTGLENEKVICLDDDF